MALFLNVRFDLYRGFNPANPYTPPNAIAAGCGLGGELIHNVRLGRFGAGQYLHWTHKLLVDLSQDLHSAYNTQLNAFNPGLADTVFIPDYPIPGWCCAFLIVDVQVLNRGGPGAYWVCYLD